MEQGQGIRCDAIGTIGKIAVVVVCDLLAGHEGPHRCRLPIPGGHREVEWP